MGEYAMVYFRHTTFALNLTEHATQLLVQALVLSRLDYCNALGWSSSLLCQTSTIDPECCLTKLHWLPVAARIKFKALTFANRTTTGTAPSYQNSLLQTYVPSRNLRSA